MWNKKLFVDDYEGYRTVKRYPGQWNNAPGRNYYDTTTDESQIDNFVYEGAMVFKRCLSAEVVEFASLTDPLGGYMFLSDFWDVLPKMRDGILVGRFTWRKKGDRFGMYLMENE